METNVTITLAEYKELIELKISASYEEQIKGLEQRCKEAEENSGYWWREWRKAEDALKAYMETHPEEKGGAVD